MNTTTAPLGSGPVTCGCGNHRSRCRFGRPHTWAMPWFDDDGELRNTARCMECRSECTAEG